MAMHDAGARIAELLHVTGKGAVVAPDFVRCSASGGLGVLAHEFASSCRQKTCIVSLRPMCSTARPEKEND